MYLVKFYYDFLDLFLIWSCFLKVSILGSVVCLMTTNFDCYGKNNKLQNLFELQADSNMNDLIAEYQQYEEAGLDDVIYEEGEYEELVDFSSDGSNNI